MAVSQDKPAAKSPLNSCHLLVKTYKFRSRPQNMEVPPGRVEPRQRSLEDNIGFYYPFSFDTVWEASYFTHRAGNELERMGFAPKSEGRWVKPNIGAYVERQGKTVEVGSFNKYRLSENLDTALLEYRNTIHPVMVSVHGVVHQEGRALHEANADMDREYVHQPPEGPA